MVARTRQSELAQRALELLERTASAAQLRAYLASYDESMEKAVAGNTYFLVKRAQIRIRLGELSAAVADARRASALQPRDLHIRAALLWTLIAARAVDPLRAEVAR